MHQPSSMLSGYSNTEPSPSSPVGMCLANLGIDSSTRLPEPEEITRGKEAQLKLIKEQMENIRKEIDDERNYYLAQIKLQAAKQREEILEDISKQEKELSENVVKHSEEQMTNLESQYKQAVEVTESQAAQLLDAAEIKRMYLKLQTDQEQLRAREAELLAKAEKHTNDTTPVFSVDNLKRSECLPSSNTNLASHYSSSSTFHQPPSRTYTSATPKQWNSGTSFFRTTLDHK